MDLPVALAQRHGPRLDPKPQAWMVGAAQSLDQGFGQGLVDDGMQDQHRTVGRRQVAGRVGIGPQQRGRQVGGGLGIPVLEPGAGTERVDGRAGSPDRLDREKLLGARLVDRTRERLLVDDRSHPRANPESPKVALQSFGRPDHDHAMNHPRIEARPAQAGSREHIGGELAIGVGLNQGDSLAAGTNSNELPVGMLVLELAGRRRGEQLGAEHPAELGEDSVDRRTCIGLALDVDPAPPSEHPPDQLEGLQWLIRQLADPHWFATMSLKPLLSQLEESALGGTDLLFTIPRDHVQALGQIIGDGVGREGQRFQQIVL